MAKDDEDHENKDDLETKLEDQDTDTPPQQSTDDKPSSKTNQEDTTDWKASYKGLQKTVAKKDKERDELQDKYDDLSAQFEELKSNSSKSQETLGELEKQLKETKDSLDSLSDERDNFKSQLERQTLIMTEFPNLAPLAKYIPESADEEEFRKNAKEFADALENNVKAGIKETLAGSGVKQPTDTEEFTSQDEVDAAYERAVALAGDPAKAKEYEEANQEYIKLFESSQDKK